MNHNANGPLEHQEFPARVMATGFLWDLLHIKRMVDTETIEYMCQRWHRVGLAALKGEEPPQESMAIEICRLIRDVRPATSRAANHRSS
jgi:hypothetical protein